MNKKPLLCEGIFFCGNNKNNSYCKKEDEDFYLYILVANSFRVSYVKIIYCMKCRIMQMNYYKKGQ